VSVILAAVISLKQEDCGPGDLGKKQDPIFKTITAKMAGGVAPQYHQIPPKYSEGLKSHRLERSKFKTFILSY
jgi:hypothetical protein